MGVGSLVGVVGLFLAVPCYADDGIHEVTPTIETILKVVGRLRAREFFACLSYFGNNDEDKERREPFFLRLSAGAEVWASADMGLR